MPDRVMHPGAVVLVTYPYTHGAQSKKRPAVVVAVAEGDGASGLLTVVRVSSRDNADEPSAVAVEHWREAGLDVPSVVEPRRLFTVQSINVLKCLGHLSDRELLIVRRRLGEYLGFR